MDYKVYFIAHGKTEEVFLKNTFQHYIYGEGRFKHIPFEILTPSNQLKINSTQIQNLESNVGTSMQFNNHIFDNVDIFLFVIMIDINERDQDYELQQKIISSDYIKESVIMPTLCRILNQEILNEAVLVKVIYCNQGIENALSINIDEARSVGKSKYIHTFLKEIKEDDSIVGSCECEKLRNYFDKCKVDSNLYELYPFYDSVIEKD